MWTSMMRWQPCPSVSGGPGRCRHASGAAGGHAGTTAPSVPGPNSLNALAAGADVPANAH